MFTQIDEPFTDKFVLGDLNINYNFGDVTLTSITSYTAPRRRWSCATRAR